MWLIFALLVSLAAFFIILPLFKKEIENESVSLNTEQLDSGLTFKDQKARLSKMLEEDLIDITEYSKLILEYERILLRGADRYSKPITNISDNKGSWVLLLCLLLMPIFVFSMYNFLGASTDLNIAHLLDKRANSGLSKLRRVELNKNLQEKIYNRLQDKPDHTYYSITLAQLKMENQDFLGAKESYLKILKLRPNDSDLLSEYAQALYFSENRKFTKEVRSIINKTIKLNPNNAVALGLNGINYFEQGLYRLAIISWENALKVTKKNTPEANALNASILHAKKFTNVNNYRLSVEIEVPEKYRINKDNIIYIYAREWEGSPRPLAAVKFRLSDLPKVVFLDDSMSMMGSKTLSSVEFLEIIARISDSGSVTPLPGDYQGSTGKFNAKEQKKAKIDINIEL
jgi:cytochrome c-type biogenesis protein CcmH